MLYDAAAATFTFPAPFVHAQKGGGTLRFVPHADLRVLDVTRYTGYITNRTNAYLVYDTLFSQDEKGHNRPQMVDTWTVSPDRRKWSFTLRDGVKFHDGQPVTAEDCVAGARPVLYCGDRAVAGDRREEFRAGTR